MTKTARHSRPLAWWVVDRVRTSSAGPPTDSSPERSLSRVISARKADVSGIAVGEERELLEVLEPGSGVLEIAAGPVAYRTRSRRAGSPRRVGRGVCGFARSSSSVLGDGQRFPRGLREIDGGGVEVEESFERVGAGHGLPEPRREPRPEAGAELHEPGEGDLVARVVDESQVGEHVLDVAVLEEPQTRADLERDVAPGELDLEIEGVRVVAVEHRHLLELDALLAQLEDGVGDPGGLELGGGDRRPRQASPRRCGSSRSSFLN